MNSKLQKIESLVRYMYRNYDEIIILTSEKN